MCHDILNILDHTKTYNLIKEVPNKAITLVKEISEIKEVKCEKSIAAINQSERDLELGFDVDFKYVSIGRQVKRAYCTGINTRNCA